MSTGADCVVREIAPDVWQYEIQQWPYGDIEDYDVNGPFPTYDAAMAHLSEHYANPGGHSTFRWPAKEVPDAVVGR